MAEAYLAWDLLQLEDRRNVIDRRRISRRRREEQNPFFLEENEFLDRYRISKEMLIELTVVLQPTLQRQRPYGLSTETQILTALRFYASGCYQKPIGLQWGSSMSQKSVSRVIHRVTTAINSHLLRKYIKFPMTATERQRAKQKFSNARHPFPDAVGAIDCTHIKILAPKVHEEAYVSGHHEGHSINVQAICDPDLLILNINARWPGARHDAHIWANSPVRSSMKRHFENADRRAWLLGDDGYPLEPWLMTSIKNQPVNTPEYNYTQAHCSARNVVERCFGVLKSTFRCLSRQRQLMYEPNIAGQIVNACAVLHNMRIKYRLNEEPLRSEDHFTSDDDRENIDAGFALNEFVRHWEAARYSPPDRGRGRRSTPSTPGAQGARGGPLELRFKAHNRDFHLRLHPDPGSVFADDAEFHGTTGPVAFNPASVYSGTLEGDESSSAHGIITSDGLFDGTIHIKNEIYYVEPLHRYGKSHPQIHSVIYKSTDVIQPSANGKKPCASHLLHQKTLNEHRTINNLVNQGTFVKYNSDIDSLRKISLKRTKRWLPDDEFDNLKMADLGYDDESQEESTSLKNPSLPIDLFIPYYDESNIEPGVHRLRNSTDRTRGILINSYDEDSYNDDSIFSRPNSKNHVEIKTKVNIPQDIINKKPIGFTYVSSLTGNMTDIALRHVNKRATIDPKKTTCMLYLQGDHQFYQKFGSEEACIEVMTRHVQRVNSIYRVTDFNQDGKPDNITFMIKRIKVHTAEALKDPLYRFPNNYGVEKFLELFSEEDYDGFCLAYMFTYRDFEMGTLGLAWTGDLKNAGGVCEKNGHYRGSLKSLNTGIVTLLNYGKHVPPAVSHVTLAHEIGHNFGSPHDPDVCTPGGEDGNFIMFARATSGDKKNNNHFSPCSLKSINPVLNNKARSSKGCFTEPQVSLCGNGVVEEGEECDCGWEGDCREPCCHPQRRHPPPGETPCRLTPRSLCSPSQGPCCTAQCSLRFGDQCRSDNGCRDASHCDGRRPSCPPSASKPNRTLCDDGFICYMGECTGSICVAYGLESCQCSSERACELCCKLPGAGNPCKSSFQWNQPPYDVPDLYAKPGTPCNDYNGYCDVFQKCREVDPSGPLATLRKLLLSEESLSSFKKWILDHWYAAVLIILVVIGLLVGSTRLLGKKSDGKLKKVTIIHSSTTETVRLPEHCPDGVIIHTAVRSKVPLKKKVALKTRVHRKAKDKSEHQVSAAVVAVPKHSKKRTQKLLNAEESPKHSKGTTSSQIEAVAIKLRKAGGINKHKIAIAKRKNKKEVIDYSATQKDREQGAVSTVPVVVEADSLGKVQNWLLNSPQPAMIKSKSTPIGLTDRTFASGSKTTNISKVIKGRYDKVNSKSVNNLTQGEKEKVRLQVIYKPPFKFSLKLCKGDKTRVVVDKTPHNRPERVKKKPHLRMPKTETRLSKTNVSPTVGPSNDITISQLSQASQSSNAASLGLNQVPDSVSYGQASNNDNSIEHRLSQYRKTGPKWTHRKSNSVGQGTQLAESRQNLLMQDQLQTNSGEMHFYENLTFASGSGDDKNNIPDKSSSMPRNATHAKVESISRQNSQSVKPSTRNNGPPRVMRMQSENLNTNIKKSFSNASQHNTNKRIQKGNSLNNLHLVARTNNSLCDRRRRHNPAEQPYSNVEPVHRFNSMEKRERRVLKGSSPHETLGKGKLRRQMSATELYNNNQNRSDCFMPISAGANLVDAYRPDFEWFKRNSSNHKVPASSSQRKGPDCLDSHLVPNIPDKQILLDRNVEKPSHKAAPAPLHRQQTSPTSSSGSGERWPLKFGELKNCLPDSNQVTNPAAYQSDMEVLVSDNDYNPYDV